jgi:antitoxin component YwqK of YwqJK toxin-antitoxin module
VVIDLPDTVDTGTSQEKFNVWTGSVADAEEQFITELVNGIDTVIDANSKQAFSGRMKILNQNGSLMGEVNLLDGQLHGEETFMNETGVVTERNIWEKGIRIK